eukprot:scaffold4449_cov49-Prasinocladus_malaysianus.AAC.2
MSRRVWATMRDLPRAGDDVQQAAGGDRHHRQPGRHGLEGHEAQGLRLGRHHEDVGAGVGLGKLPALDHALIIMHRQYTQFFPIPMCLGCRSRQGNSFVLRSRQSISR